MRPVACAYDEASQVAKPKAFELPPHRLLTGDQRGEFFVSGSIRPPHCARGAMI